MLVNVERRQQHKHTVGRAEIVIGLGELESKLEIAFSMDYCLSINRVSSVGWYVVSGASRHMTCDRKSFNKFSE
jgi:hypothetical protein